MANANITVSLMPLLNCLYIYYRTRAVKTDDSGHPPPTPHTALDDSEEDGLWESLEVDGRMPYGRMTFICSTDRTGRRQQGTENV
jgi:hypothetical protein